MHWDAGLLVSLSLDVPPGFYSRRVEVVMWMQLPFVSRNGDRSEMLKLREVVLLTDVGIIIIGLQFANRSMALSALDRLSSL